MKINKDYLALIVFGIIFVLYLNVSLNSPIVFGDEGYYAYQAKWIADNHMMPDYEMMRETDVFHPVFTKPPLYVVFEAFTFYFGIGFVKFMLPIFSLLTAFVLYIFMKKVANEKVGLVAGFLFLAAPSLITYGVMSYVDTLLCLLMSLSLYFGYKMFEDGNRRDTILSGVFLGLAILTKITAPILFVIFVLYGLIFKKFNRWKELALIIIIACAIVSPWIVRNYALFGNYCYGPGTCPAIMDTTIPVDEALSVSWAGTTSGGGTESSLMSLGILPYSNFAFGWILPFLVIFGLVEALKMKNKMQMMMVVFIICMLPIFIYYSGRVEDAARYTLPILIPMAILGGVFLTSSYDWVRKKSFIAAILIVIIVLSGTWVYGQEKLNTMQQVKSFSSGFFDACDWVKTNTPEDSLLLSVYSQQTAFSCERRTSTAVPDMADIELTNDERSYEHLTLHGYDYIFVQVGLISQEAYEESVPYGFFNYMTTSSHFEKVFDNTQTYSSGGVIIFKVK